MRYRLGIVLGVVVLAASSLLEGQSATHVTRLTGKTGFSREFASGWLDLSPTDFSQGEHLVLTVGGTATAVVVRMLPKGSDPNQPDVVIGERVSVRADRTIDVALKGNLRNIVQISVHGGPSPWNQFPLSAGNGPATLVAVDRVTRQ